MKTKRFVTVLLSVLLVLQMLPAAAQAAAPVPGSAEYAAVVELPVGADKIVTSIDESMK